MEFRSERELREQQERAFKKGDEQIIRDMDEFDWSVGDVPGSGDVFRKKEDRAAKAAVVGPKSSRPGPRPPPTLASRQAASALAMAPKALAISQPKTSRPLAAPKTRLFPIPGRTDPKRTARLEACRRTGPPLWQLPGVP